MKNNPETEINRIRVKLYEETKDLTPAEQTRRSNELAQKLSSQYGFTIRQSVSENKTITVV